MILLEVEKNIFETECLDWDDNKQRMDYSPDTHSQNNYFWISCEINFQYNCLRTSGREFNFIEWVEISQNSELSPYLPTTLAQGYPKPKIVR